MPIYVTMHNDADALLMASLLFPIVRYNNYLLNTRVYLSAT